MNYSTIPSEIRDEILMLRRFHQLMEQQLRAVNLAEAKMIHATFKVDSTFEKSPFLYENSPENRDLNTFPKKLRYSIVIHLFTIFETYASQLCDEISYYHSGHNLRLSDFSGSTNERVKRYYATYTKLMAKEAPEWEAIEWLEKLRHLIVHSNGAVPTTRAGVFFRNLRNRKVGLSIDSGGQIHLSHKLIVRLIDGLDAWFNTAISRAKLPIIPD